MPLEIFRKKNIASVDFFLFLLDFPSGSAGKEFAFNGDPGSIPGSGRSTGEGKGNPLQYSGLENSTDCIVHAVTKSQTQLSNFHFFIQLKARKTNNPIKKWGKETDISPKKTYT